VGDEGDLWRAVRAERRDKRMRLGVECPRCKVVRPNACPSILLPQQRCKVDGYRDPRPTHRGANVNDRLPRQTGTVGILNVGAGDTKLSFDPNNPAERIRAARIVKDMLRRGYALLVEVERDGVKKYERALDFDESVCEYVIADFDPVVAAEQDSKESTDGTEDRQAETHDPKATAEAAPKIKRGRKRVAAESARAVAVARTAGG
jgi:hypothetical protein